MHIQVLTRIQKPLSLNKSQLNTDKHASTHRIYKCKARVSIRQNVDTHLVLSMIVLRRWAIVKVVQSANWVRIVAWQQTTRQSSVIKGNGAFDWFELSMRSLKKTSLNQKSKQQLSKHSVEVL